MHSQNMSPEGRFTSPITTMEGAGKAALGGVSPKAVISSPAFLNPIGLLENNCNREVAEGSNRLYEGADIVDCQVTVFPKTKSMDFSTIKGCPTKLVHLC
ncbi:hypothetical protein HS088_TW06G00848 [Tripterygium wilfordii]|uniref:Uncharacterized protein n=1 Tax=Tripterygium wilfordii TaxID=458696 RepID=A0A7J7DKS3_TRIWF|nr:hypothetical protein HS088_TW06G00848 [Tripterygium wilfordii]